MGAGVERYPRQCAQKTSAKEAIRTAGRDEGKHKGSPAYTHLGLLVCPDPNGKDGSQSLRVRFDPTGVRVIQPNDPGSRGPPSAADQVTSTRSAIKKRFQEIPSCPSTHESTRSSLQDSAVSAQKDRVRKKMRSLSRELCRACTSFENGIALKSNQDGTSCNDSSKQNLIGSKTSKKRLHLLISARSLPTQPKPRVVCSADESPQMRCLGRAAFDNGIALKSKQDGEAATIPQGRTSSIPRLRKTRCIDILKESTSLAQVPEVVCSAGCPQRWQRCNLSAVNSAQRREGIAHKPSKKTVATAPRSRIFSIPRLRKASSPVESPQAHSARREYESAAACVYQE
ncbi:hypothetical protein PRZ48_005264 [Zasmidium cellare]|uniref:Uncharacterized protein n=1 Tax=Zasmidium cellare TaxID=395010 RepID=A0ABR0ET45_ZASCE|nr:hypothetical protein PRZ48_005264 [Zasmidium cellare]